MALLLASLKRAGMAAAGVAPEQARRAEGEDRPAPAHEEPQQARGWGTDNAEFHQAVRHISTNTLYADTPIHPETRQQRRSKERTAAKGGRPS